MQPSNTYYRNIIFILSTMLILAIGGLLFILLVESGHARDNTIILCKGVLLDNANAAKTDQETNQLCAEVGVTQ